MSSLHPTYLSRYISWKKNSISGNLQHFFYTSWEDALWDVLKNFSIAQNSIILLPDFFCGDVIQNMQRHGLQCVFYRMDKNFFTDPQLFSQLIQKHQPQIVLIFHAVGITNQLLTQFSIWKDSLPPSCILLEDSVHRLVRPEKIQLLTPFHFVIDSLRKVSPLPGSNLFMDQTISFQQTPISPTRKYRLEVFLWWFVFQFCLKSASLSPVSSLKKWWNTQAEKAMLAGYEVIGDSDIASPGWQWASFLSRFFQFSEIEKKKQEQVASYEKKLTPLWKDSRFFKIPIPEKDWGLLRAYPVGFSLQTADTILASLRKKGLLVRFELNDSPWSTRQKVIYLPLGPHLSTQDTNWVAKIMLDHLQSRS